MVGRDWICSRLKNSYSVPGRFFACEKSARTGPVLASNRRTLGAPIAVNAQLGTTTPTPPFKALSLGVGELALVKRQCGYTGIKHSPTQLLPFARGRVGYKGLNN